MITISLLHNKAFTFPFSSIKYASDYGLFFDDLKIILFFYGEEMN